MPRSRQIAIAILGILTIGFAIASAYIGLQVLQEDTAPDDSAAFVGLSCDEVICERSDGTNFSAGPDCEYTGGSCAQRAESFCSQFNAQVVRGNSEIPRDQNADCPAPTTPIPSDSNDECVDVNNPSTYKNIGDTCNLDACGTAACDGNGPLGCNVCPSDSLRPGQSVCSFFYENDNDRSLEALYAACGSPGTSVEPNPSCIDDQGNVYGTGQVLCTQGNLGRVCGAGANGGFGDEVIADACGAGNFCQGNEVTSNESFSNFGDTCASGAVWAQNRDYDIVCCSGRVFLGCGDSTSVNGPAKDNNPCSNCYDTNGDGLADECLFEGSSCGAKLGCAVGDPVDPPSTPPSDPPPSDPPPPPADAICGEACTQDSDCIDANNVCGTNGECQLNTCANNPDACNADLCSIAPTNQVGSVTGQAYCQDPSDTLYPIPNSVVTLTYSDGTQVTATTDASGNYTIPNLDNPSDSSAPYVIDVEHNLPQGSLPATGQSYASFSNADAVNCDVPSSTGCSAASCGTNNESYDACTLDDGESGSNFDFAYTNCTPVVDQCIQLLETGPDPIDSGEGNIIQYSLEYQSASATNPFPNIRLRVGPNGAPVGRDENSNGSVLVAPFISVRVESQSRWLYSFAWEAEEVGGGAVSDGTYDVRILTDGVSTEISSAACQETVTVTSGTPQEPVFNIVKTSAEVCLQNGDAQIDYTVTVSNIGPVSGVIDYVEDTYDSDFARFNISPTAINPSNGVDNGTTIRWTGDVSDRTFAVDQSRDYTYRVVIPQNVLINFANGVLNEAEVQYTTDEPNSLTFTLETPVSCTIPGLPDTSIFESDTQFILLGIIFIVGGLIVFKTGFGSSTVQVLLNEGVESVEKTTTKVMPFEERLDREADKRRREKKKKKKKK